MITTTDIRLKPEIIQQIRDNQGLRNRLQLEMKISHTTLYRLLGNNSERLTTAMTLKTISEELNIVNDDLLTEV